MISSLREKMGSRIAGRLVVATILFSSIITLITTGIQIYLDYRHDIGIIENSFGIIKRSHLKSLANSVWNFDEDQVVVKLEELLQLPDMEFIEISGSNQGGWSRGRVESGHTVEAKFPLLFNYIDEPMQLGEIRVVASLDSVYSRLIRKAVLILISNTFKTFLVSGFILLLFNYLVTRHLNTLAAHVRDIRFDEGDRRCRLNRKRREGASPDELEQVVSAINTIQGNLRQAFKDLSESEKRFRDLFENSPVSLWVEDFSRVRQYVMGLRDEVTGEFGDYLEQNPHVVQKSAELVEIVDLNKATLSLHGADKKEELLDKLPTTFTPASYWAFRKQVAAIWEDRRQVETDAVVQTLTGVLRHVNLRWQVAPGHEEDLSKVLVSMIDISERKRAEEELAGINAHLEELVEERTLELEENIEKARAANRAKSEFLARMSHEIRTPMNAIIGLTNLVIKSGLSPRQQGHLTKVCESSNHLLSVINELLDFSKIEEGKLLIEERPFMLSDLIGKAAGILGDRSAQKRVELYYIIGKDVPLSLIGDPFRVNQILINLLGNAIKFTEKGQVILKVELAEGAPAGEKVKLLFSVRDTGIGIPADHIENLFHPFTQADGSVTRKYGGTGLGLAICRRMVDLMGGRIWAESEEGAGSTFNFILPFGYGGNGEGYALTSPGDMTGLKVLVVDDNEAARLIFTEMLGAFGSFRVKAVGSGRDALAELTGALGDKPYDLVLLDWKMPDMDGFEVARRIETDPVLGEETVSPRVIMVTMYGREDVFPKISEGETGIDGFLIKPVNSSEMFNAIMEAFDRRDALIPARRTETVEADSKALARISGARVLLVEDNLINQNVAVAVLEGAGLVTEVASNGMEAVEMLGASRTPSYDVVLMDIEMPEMDGYEATRKIRENLAMKGLPVIAMTAHAMKGDREKCIAAGMNDYLSKPIDEKELYTALCRWIGRDKAVTREAAEPEKSVAAPSPGILPERLPGIDLDSVLKRVRGDEGLLRSMLIHFRDSYEDAGERIREALEAGKRSEAKLLVHSIKGVSGNLSAGELHGATRALDLALKQEGMNGVAELLSVFDEKLSVVTASLKTLSSEDRKPAVEMEMPGDRPANGAVEADGESSEHPLLRMHALLSRNRSRGWHFIDPLLSILPDRDFPEEKASLERAMAQLDTEKALVILSRLAEQLNIPLEGGE